MPHVSGEAEVGGQSRDELLEHDAQLHARELVAEAEVRPALAERDVVDALARDIESVGVVEHTRVAIA